MAQLSIRTQNEDGERVTRTFHIEDDHAEDERGQLEAIADQAEEVPELREELSKTEDELDTIREVLVSDIVRRKKLAGKYDGEDALDQAEDQEFLEGLPAGRLKMHYERAPSGEELSTDAATSNDDPPEGNPDDVYGDAVVEA
jgi:hypothetical protein